MAASVLDQIVRRYDGLTVHTSPVPLHYYDAKLEGARLASTDVVVFADSDLRYEAGWLAALLAPFTDPDVDFVTGETRVAITGPYTFSVATTWLFPRRYDAGPAPSLIANNCAVRRQALLAHPFPQDLPLYRAQITLHGRQLRARGRRIVHVAARGWHAPPEGAREWALRYLVSGADSTLAGTWEVDANGTLHRDNTATRRGRAWAIGVARKLLSSVVRMLQAWADRPSTLLYSPLSLPLSMVAIALFVGGGFSAVCGSRSAHDRMRDFEIGAGGVH